MYRFRIHAIKNNTSLYTGGGGRRVVLLGAFVDDLDIANWQLKTAFNAECIDLVCRTEDKPKGCRGGGGGERRPAGRRGSGSRGVLASTLPRPYRVVSCRCRWSRHNAAKFKVTRPCSPKHVNCPPAWVNSCQTVPSEVQFLLKSILMHTTVFVCVCLCNNKVINRHVQHQQRSERSWAN